MSLGRCGAGPSIATARGCRHVTMRLAALESAVRACDRGLRCHAERRARAWRPDRPSSRARTLRGRRGSAIAGARADRWPTPWSATLRQLCATREIDDASPSRRWTARARTAAASLTHRRCRRAIVATAIGETMLLVTRPQTMSGIGESCIRAAAGTGTCARCVDASGGLPPTHRGRRARARERLQAARRPDRPFGGACWYARRALAEVAAGVPCCPRSSSCVAAGTRHMSGSGGARGTGVAARSCGPRSWRERD